MKNIKQPRRPTSSSRAALVPVELGATGVAPLDPEQLAPLAQDAIQALLAEGESDNTVRSYQAALRYWAAWFTLRYRQPIAMPVAVPVVLQFIVDHAERLTGKGLESQLPGPIDQALVDGGFKARLGPPAMATLLHRISVLSKVHQIKELANPCQDPLVRELLTRTRRAYAKRGVTADKKPALTREPLEALLATCDDSLRGIRDRALLLFAWSSGGRRRSEVTVATLENTRRVGEDAYLFTLAHSKTDPSGARTQGQEKPVVGLAAQALQQWIQRAGLQSGPIFRRIRRGDVVGEPLSPAAVRDIVRQRCALAGLGDEFSAHSLRSGFVTEAARQNVPIGETMAMTGHTSVATVVGYFRNASMLDGSSAKLMESGRAATQPTHPAQDDTPKV